MAKQKEIWRDIENYEGFYQVSNLGNVKSLNYHNTKQARILIKPLTIHGYERIALWKNGKAKKFFVHRLVAIAFIPNPYNKSQVNHINGIKTDNRVKNLEWATAQENKNHAIKTKLWQGQKGENNSSAKLTNDQVRKIREEYIPRDENHNMYTLSRKYGVTPSKICDIIHYKTYK